MNFAVFYYFFKIVKLSRLNPKDYKKTHEIIGEACRVVIKKGNVEINVEGQENIPRQAYDGKGKGHSNQQKAEIRPYQTEEVQGFNAACAVIQVVAVLPYGKNPDCQQHKDNGNNARKSLFRNGVDNRVDKTHQSCDNRRND